MIHRMNDNELEDFLNQEIHPTQPFPTKWEGPYPYEKKSNKYDSDTTMLDILIEHKKWLFIKDTMLVISILGLYVLYIYFFVTKSMQ